MGLCYSIGMDQMLRGEGREAVDPPPGPQARARSGSVPGSAHSTRRQLATRSGGSIRLEWEERRGEGECGHCLEPWGRNKIVSGVYKSEPHGRNTSRVRQRPPSDNARSGKGRLSDIANGTQSTCRRAAPASHGFEGRAQTSATHAAYSGLARWGSGTSSLSIISEQLISFVRLRSTPRKWSQSQRHQAVRELPSLEQKLTGHQLISPLQRTYMRPLLCWNPKELSPLKALWVTIGCVVVM
ncbi:hypothetical protein B0T16DRAFT_393479 [Cercophora newfieldiana]|uniref:Uncharacterized protein n=1 Tax=Cercophora newfieldiana TaxID=92897 RepID=A0AA39XVR7_9PEZI|nr:hypothetical protein B0T16DRAFT_393479 [Cercophora newfieldiana]